MFDSNLVIDGIKQTEVLEKKLNLNDRKIKFFLIDFYNIITAYESNLLQNVFYVNLSPKC